MRLSLPLTLIACGILLQFGLVEFLIYLFSQDNKLLTNAVIKELRLFTTSVGVPGLKFFRYSQLMSSPGSLVDPSIGQGCFKSLAGGIIQYRCGPYYTNLMGALVEKTFSYSQDEGQQRGINDLPSFNTLVKLYNEWKGTNVKDEIVSVTVKIAGVDGWLSKCKFPNSHHYLIFQSEETEDIIIDASYKQFMVMSAAMFHNHVEAAEKMLDHLPWTFVGTHDTLDKLYDPERLSRDMTFISKKFHIPSWSSSFQEFHNARKLMSDIEMKPKVCRRIHSPKI